MPEVNLLGNLEQLNQQLESASPQEILRCAADRFGQGLVIVTSFQHTGIATIHMMQKIAPHIPVMTLDTGLLFPETYALIDEMTTRFNLNLIRLQPDLTVQEQATHHGEKLWQSNPDACCHMRKVIPLDRGLTPFDAWVTGLRRDQSPARANTPIVSKDRKRPGKFKIAPFVNWTAEMVEIYIRAHDLPYNALYDQNYLSIGCWPCTQPVQPGEDARAGRWVNSNKIECGIHTDTPHQD